MSNSFDSTSQSVGSLLGPTIRSALHVPPFQRGYSWQKKHVETFWRDVIQFLTEREAPNGPQKYFLGPIVVLNKPDGAVEVLDGQQRLATATILLCAIRDQFRTYAIPAATDEARDVQTGFIIKPDDVGFSIVLGEMDRQFFRDTIQADPPTPKKATIASHRHIANAQLFLRAQIATRVNGMAPTIAIASLKKLTQALRSDFVVASIPVTSERDAFRIFETLNDRGLRLSVPDLLLNYLMGQARPEDRGQLREHWNEMIERMGRRDVNRFIRHMWISKYGDLKNTDLYSAIKSHIESHKTDSLVFTRDCATECERYAQIIDVDESVFEKSALPVLRALVKKLDVNATLPVLLSSIANVDGAAFEKIIRWLLVFVTRYSVLSNLDSSGLESIVYGLARDIRAKAPDQKAIMAHIKQTLIDNCPTNDAVQVAVKTLTLSPDEALYVVERLAQRMQSATKEVALGESNLEHVYPRNPAKDGWGGAANQEILGPYLWHIGNLTMLGQRLNRDAGNKEYDVKRQAYAQKTELEMAKAIAARYEQWNKITIEDRAERLAPLVLEIWNFDNPSRV